MIFLLLGRIECRYFLGIKLLLLCCINRMWRINCINWRIFTLRRNRFRELFRFKFCNLLKYRFILWLKMPSLWKEVMLGLLSIGLEIFRKAFLYCFKATLHWKWIRGLFSLKLGMTTMGNKYYGVKDIHIDCKPWQPHTDWSFFQKRCCSKSWRSQTSI